jgi:hypothetical protein
VFSHFEVVVWYGDDDVQRETLKTFRSAHLLATAYSKDDPQARVELYNAHGAFETFRGGKSLGWTQLIDGGIEAPEEKILSIT